MILVLWHQRYSELVILRALMDSARSWFQKFQPREKGVTKKSEMGLLDGLDDTEESPSDATRQRVAAAKQYIENHYKEQMKNLQERKERYGCRKTIFSPLFFAHFFYCINKMELDNMYLFFFSSLNI